MTTVVASVEIGAMAADHRCTGGGAFFHVEKIQRIKGSLFGWCGDAMLAVHMLNWLKGNRDPLELYKLIPEAHRDEISFLELGKDGLSFWTGWGSRLALLDSSYAIGSGAMAALKALRMGCPPGEAVIHATEMDECSGTFVLPQVVMLREPRKRRA